MADAAALVLIVTSAAQALGPRLAGLLAMFPVMSTVLVGFTHRESGGAVAIRMLRGMIYGYFGFAIFCATLALALPALPIRQSFALALVAAIAVHAGVRWWMPRSV